MNKNLINLGSQCTGKCSWTVRKGEREKGRWEEAGREGCVCVCVREREREGERERENKRANTL